MIDRAKCRLPAIARTSKSSMKMRRQVFASIQQVRHDLHRHWVWRCWQHLGKRVTQRWGVRLPTHRDQRRNPGSHARGYVRRTEISHIHPQCFHFPHSSRQGVDLIQHQFNLLFVVGRLHHVHRNHQQAIRCYRSLGVVALLETAAGHRHDPGVLVRQIDLVRG